MCVCVVCTDVCLLDITIEQRWLLFGFRQNALSCHCLALLLYATRHGQPKHLIHPSAHQAHVHAYTTIWNGTTFSNFELQHCFRNHRELPIYYHRELQIYEVKMRIRWRNCVAAFRPHVSLPAATKLPSSYGVCTNTHMNLKKICQRIDIPFRLNVGELCDRGLQHYM